MTIALWATLAALAAGMFVLLGAQVEHFDQLKQLRRELALEEKTVPLDIDAVGLPPSAVGLPDELDRLDEALVVFLSDRCTTCYTIAGAFHGGDLPPATWLVVLPVNDDGGKFVERFQLYGERIIVDRGRTIPQALGLEASPSSVLIVSGLLAGAQSVPSIRQLKASFPNPKQPHTEPHTHPHSDLELDGDRPTALLAGPPSATRQE